MPSQRKVPFFRENPLLRGLPRDLVARIAEGSELTRIPRRTRLWEPGDRADRVYWLRSGVVKLGVPVEAGRELTLEFHGKGALIGESAVLSSDLRSSCAEVYEEAVVHATPVGVLGPLLDGQPLLARRISALVGRRRQRLEARLATLLFRGSHARLAALFLELAREFGVRDSRGVIVNLKLTHREMASLIGASRETVSFALLDMRRDGLVQTDGKRVVLLDEARLEALRSSGS